MGEEVKQLIKAVEKIFDNINVPKQILDKGEALAKTLFGQAFSEMGGLIGDQVKFMRFINQVKILQKANSILEAKGINPKKISLKVLAPLIEYSSLEDDELLQDKWSNLISNILSQNLSILLQKKSIEILSEISNHEAQIIDYMYKEVVKLENKKLDEDFEAHYKQVEEARIGIKNLDLPPDYISFYKIILENEHTPGFRNFKLDYIHFDLNFLEQQFGSSESDTELAISSLVALGLVKRETKVEVSSYGTPAIGDSFGMEASVSDNEQVTLTKLGYEFVKLCNT